ncbi:DNA-3-methyladenine glycosylase [Actinomyces gaoshouyii]|uniref:DNA-3-methyladenine glycosylase n=1 Tax=Actinomyces gaoshouyii TaxID=1960083 RepID=UPI0009BD58AD|nr:DNA-3-methyladenine glycosylase [Actinomyces gaoshouyii]ARD42715.1 3-methyladenine DNA glycosylase [Actinomyces gaoshouyii]
MPSAPDGPSESAAPEGSGRGIGLAEETRRLLALDCLEAAPQLLGAVISATDSAGTVSVRLTEVEAYRGEQDPGSHAYRGPTARNASMFCAGGVIYVYFTYGMHHCVNVVTGPEGVSRAVLLRGGEVVEGLELARSRRPAARSDRDLARGPARLCRALGLSLDDDGVALGAPGSRVSLALAEPGTAPAPDAVRTGARTGVSGPGGDGRLYPWRFWIDGEPTVSPYRAAAPRRARRGGASPGGL